VLQQPSLTPERRADSLPDPNHSEKMKLNSPTELFFDQLKDLYSVESQVILTLPDLADNASDPALRSLLLDHEGESERHKTIVKRIFETHGRNPGGDICKAIKGLIEGGNEHLAKAEDPLVRDLLLIAHCNRIKHYEIAAYGFTVALAQCVGLINDARALGDILSDEREFARHLESIAEELFGAPVGGLQ